MLLLCGAVVQQGAVVSFLSLQIHFIADLEMCYIRDVLTSLLFIECLLSCSDDLQPSGC